MKLAKKNAIFAQITALCLFLCGCNNNNPDPAVTESNTYITTPNIEEISVTETAQAETDTVTITAASISEESSTAADTENSTSEAQETNTEQVTSSIQAETDPPPVTTTAPAILSEPSPPTIYKTTADGVLTNSNNLATVDYSNTSDGYIMAKYTGSVSLIKIQITNPAGKTQTYTLNSEGRYEAFPLTGNNGSYSFRILENVSGNGYALAHSGSFDVQLSNALAPYLRPSSYVNYSYGDSAVTKSSELCGGAANDLEKVDRVYSWLVDNVVYDHDFASSKIAGGYVCDTEKVIKQKKGICLDYAGTLAAMLRSQNIPVQVVAGHVSGSTSLHAWVNVYVKDVGWVYGAIYFDGSAWHRLDPTFAASSNSSGEILKYIGNGSNYYEEQFN